MSDSWIETLRQYLASRLPVRLYVPCAALLVVAGLAGGRALNATELAVSLLLAFTLLLQFRLLDDISDLPHDRQAHPDRVLVRADSLGPFRALLAVSCLFNLALLALQAGPAHRLGVFSLLTTAYFLWYCIPKRGQDSFVRSTQRAVTANESRPLFAASKVIGYHFVAGKYPAFVFLLSGDGGSRWSLALAMALVYLSFAIYEVLHDRSLQTTPGADKALRLEIGALFVVSALMTLDLVGGVLAVAVLQGLLGVVSLLVLGDVFGRRRIHLESAKAGYLVFVVAFALSVNFSLGVRL